ncbi:P-loop containing nucleoside triphosphate hydrolase protein [Mycena polygramma]|nr:P-loop containing nucleoside triphosphate hydrolase protein [Mycena polygramma]
MGDNTGTTSTEISAPGMLLQVKRIDKIRLPDSGEWTIHGQPLAILPGETSASPASPASPAAPKDKYSDWAEHAFLVRRKIRGHMDGTCVVLSTRLLIRSGPLREALRDMLQDSANVSWSAPIVKLDPYLLLAFLPRMKDMITELSGSSNTSDGAASDKKTHLTFLVDFLESEYSSLLQKARQLLEHGEISFELLWAVFTPGEVLVTSCPTTGEPRAFRLRRFEKDLSWFTEKHIGWDLVCEYVEVADSGDSEDSDSGASPSQHFGLADKDMHIGRFEGVRKITDLHVCPIRYHQSIDALTAKLAARGKAWVALAGIHHKQYAGVGWRNGRKVQVNGRIMIDRETLKRSEPNYRAATADRSLQGLRLDRVGVANTPDKDGVSGKDEELGDGVLLLATPIVHGFSLTEKHWLAFNIEHISPIQWNDEAFVQLAIDPTRKNLLQALVASHAIEKTSFDDFVTGKGRGLVMNLFGPPGVGKTLTVEATSEYLQKPLYVVSAAELGTTPDELQEALTKIFGLAPVWGAIVLMDEADVFLEARSTADVERNAMVAVFLRQLEYYQGILFLTTNRVKQFDHAFQSRIHLSLNYRPLSRASKAQLWRALLEKTRGVGQESPEFSTDEIEALSVKDLNGRQIKNIVQLSAALAAYEGAALRYDHLVRTMEATEEWEEA